MILSTTCIQNLLSRLVYSLFVLCNCKGKGINVSFNMNLIKTLNELYAYTSYKTKKLIKFAKFKFLFNIRNTINLTPKRLTNMLFEFNVNRAMCSFYTKAN